MFVYHASMSAHAERLAHSILEHFLKPFAIAASFVVVALLWSFPLQHVIAYPFVFLFFGAIICSAWFGGIVAGFAAIVLSSIMAAFFFIPPLYSISVGKESQNFFTAFILCAIAITVVSSARKRAENAIREARDQLEEKVRLRTAQLEKSNLEIQESERQLRLLTEAIPQQIWRADAAGAIEYCNQHLIDYLGRVPDLLRGEAFFAILHPEDEPLFRERWSISVESGSRFEMEARIRGTNGIYRWFLVRSFPQLAADGTVTRWYGIHIDVEDQHRAQQDLVEAQEHLSRLSHTLEMAEMAASIAHELNQPLTAVVTHAYACREWLSTEPANLDKASATADKIVRESTRASAVVSRVRALFRKGDQLRESTNINQVIRDFVRLLRDEAIRRDVSITLLLAGGLPPIEIDPIQIQQVLLNLAMNGMEAMAQFAAPRELAIRTERRGDREVLIAVEDRGPGISEELAPRIFEPFFSTKSEGTGMGLAICRSIVEMHDGRLWVANSPHGGAIFQFTIPTQK